MNNTEQGSGPSELELLKNRARLLGIEFSNNIGLETLKERVNNHLKEMGEDPIPEKTAQPNPLVTPESQAQDFDSDIAEETADETQQEEQGEESEQEQIDPNLVRNIAQQAAQSAQAPKIEQPQIKPQRVVDPSPATALGSAVAMAPGKPLSARQVMYNEQMKLIRVRIHNMDPKKSSLQGEIITIANRVLGNVKVFVPFGEATEDGWHIPYIIYKELNRRKFLQITSVRDKQTRQIKVTKKWMKEFALDVLPPLTPQELARLATAQLAAGSIDNSAGDML